MYINKLPVDYVNINQYTLVVFCMWILVQRGVYLNVSALVPSHCTDIVGTLEHILVSSTLSRYVLGPMLNSTSSCQRTQILREPALFLNKIVNDNKLQDGQRLVVVQVPHPLDCRSPKVHDPSMLRPKIILSGDQVWKMARMTKRPSQYIPEGQSRLKDAFRRTKLDCLIRKPRLNFVLFFTISNSDDVVRLLVIPTLHQIN